MLRINIGRGYVQYAGGLQLGCDDQVALPGQDLQLQ